MSVARRATSSVSIMLSVTAGTAKNGTLMADYAALVAESVLRQRVWLAEQAALVETRIASKVKSEFIGNMSHELRTPLNTIIGFAKLLGEHDRKYLRSGEIVEYADLIGEAAQHLLAVVNDILDISKMQSGKYVLDAGDVDLNELLGTTVASFNSVAADAGVTFSSRLAAGLPPVKGDAGKLRQIFFNLIANAIRFTPRGGAVSVAARALPDGGIEALVCDTGLGMSENELRLALTPFSQLDAGLARRCDGTGLGLPLAKALVELHGGRIHVSSAKARGTEVAVILPSRTLALLEREDIAALAPETVTLAGGLR
jgi:two-component system, cell cycle sensor histidine kinase PleC